MAKFIDKDFETSTSPVMALVTARNCTYIICRGEAAATQIKVHLQDMAPVNVTTSEAYRAIPDNIKSRFFLSTNSIVKLPEGDLGNVVMALSQDFSGIPRNHLISASLQAEALKAASSKHR
jgi:hypothetical protein